MIGIRWVWLLSMSLILLAGVCLRAGETDTKADEIILAQVNLKIDGPSLLAFFKQRTLNDGEMIQVEALIQQLGAKSFAKRELATAKLIARGPVIVPTLKKYYEDTNLEISGRAKKCVQDIQEKDIHTTKVLQAALRVLAERKPEGVAEGLLQYLPFAQNDEIGEETRKMLAVVALKNGKAEPALVKGLTEKNPILRSAAGEALALAKDKENEPAIWKLLEDPEILVKYRVALGLTFAEQAKAVPTLIKLLPELDWPQACQVEDLLIKLAEGKNLPEAAIGQSKEAREKCSKAWSKWWQDNGKNVTLARLKSGTKLLGYTLLVLLEAGQIVELGNNNEIRWQISGLNFPLDVQLLPDDRVLIAEYHGGKVTERDHKGVIHWQYPTFGPLAAQRLENGNTFIVTDEELMEVTMNKNKVFSKVFGKLDRVMKAVKMADGRMVCLTNGSRVLVLDEKGNETKSFNVAMNKQLFGGRLYMTPAGRVLIPHNSENKVIEYDLAGNEVWKLNIKEPVAAVRLPNGNTLVTTMEMPGKVIEFDRSGNEVWSYQTQGNTKITRALRR